MDEGAFYWTIRHDGTRLAIRKFEFDCWWGVNDDGTTFDAYAVVGDKIPEPSPEEYASSFAGSEDYRIWLRSLPKKVWQPGDPPWKR